MHVIAACHAVQDKAAMQQNLQQLARGAQWLVLWLDCDREGENIGFEVLQVCSAANPRLTVFRARFSALIPRELNHAMATLGQPNQLDALAVDARQEIDLRVGASFTRFQTLLLQDRFDWAAGGLADDKPLISYGPCQFPTLGLIVQRAWEIQSHVSEPFWYIHASLRVPPPQASSCDFTWARGRLFDRDAVTVLYEACSEAPTATVTQIELR
ncbi:DNA topoisomerase III [Monoraphidium neglectum]|uniref:DNA topoisomerase n=1 Tax=Monoraphidium neglectum TaxID=145388 RepID=A0A0D2M1D5_9CHLO|nr:DNA topoisomerase III [Monoraphidium neglectum]KIY95271.1 DNA topoisomerase III [Monoraphidium neglectum]|eukprot:XP_013894291.1 DNA topoisomerase III [Monoraphidium neglectum]